MYFGDFITRGARWYPDQTATVFENIRLTYSQLNRRTNALAHALRGLGVKQRERVALICHNSHQYFESVFAIAKIGAVSVNLNWRLSLKELAFLIDDADANIILFSKRFEQQFGLLKSQLERSCTFIAIDGQLEGMLNYETLISGSPDYEPQTDIQPDDTVLQIYTSGTTGRPKGVMLTHQNFISHAFNTLLETTPKRMGTVALNILPMFHIAIYVPINVMFSGGTNVLMAGFEVDSFLQTVEKERVNSVSLTPAIVKFILDYPKLDDYDLSSLERVSYAAAPMPLPLLERAMDKLNCCFAQSFGMTEMSPVMTILPPEEHVTEGPEYRLKRLTSVGRPIVNVEVKVVDDQGKECPKGVIGEIIGKGPTVMKGYHKMPEATAEVIKNGWYYTGDMGYFDEYGYLYLADRKKDMIISGGENIYPKEVEDCIMQLEGVADVAVIGVPHAKWIETVKAVVVLSPVDDLSESDIIAHCKANIASYKKPTSVDFLDKLPRNSMAKLQKHILREPYWRGHNKLW